ncbi:MAG: Fe-S cluster assembly protein SufB, partial [Pseudomonadota bacterium]
MTQEHIDKAITREYAAGFTTMIESETFPPGLNEDVVRALSAKKNEPEWMLEWRLEAFRV